MPLKVMPKSQMLSVCLRKQKSAANQKHYLSVIMNPAKIMLIFKADIHIKPVS